MNVIKTKVSRLDPMIFSLKSKTSLFISGLVIIALSLAMLFASLKFSNQTKEILFEQQFAMVSVIAGQIDQKIISSQEQLVLLASMIPHDLLKDGVELQEFLRSHTDSLVAFDGLSVLSPTGKMMAITPLEEKMIGKDCSRREFFLKTRSTLTPQISKPFLTSRSSAEPTIVFTAPILGPRRELLGILVGSFHLMQRNFLGDLATVKIGKAGHFHVLNSEGLFLVHPDQRRILKSARSDALFDKAINGFEGTGECNTSNGLAIVASFKRLKSTDWIVAADLPREEAYVPFHVTKRYLIALLVATIIGSVAMLWWAITSLMTPLSRLTQHIRDIGDDKIALQPIQSDSNDEIGVLTQTFNKMAVQLSRQKKEIVEQKEFCAKLVESAAVPIFVVDSKHRVTIWNRACEELTGVTAPEVIGSDESWKPFYTEKRPTLADLVLYRDNQQLTYLYDSYDKSPLASDGLRAEGWYASLNGRNRYLIMDAVPIIKDDTVIASIETIQDLTELKEVSEELGKAMAAADAAKRAKNEFLVSISDEIRTPMNGVLGMTELLLQGEMPKPQRYDVKAIKNSVEVALSLVNNLLDLSKLEAGKLAVEEVPFGLRATVEDAIGIVAETVYGKGIEVASLVTDDVPDTLIGDPVRLRQILNNLLDNAVKFTERGEIIVTMKKVEEDADSVLVHCEVLDTGCGIAPEAQSMLFDRFLQRDAAPHERGGDRLGLIIVKKLVALQGGEVGVTSEMGSGSAFWFRIRFKKGGTSAIAEETRHSFYGGRALIVDDNSTILSLLLYKVASMGISADIAFTGEGALALYKANHYDVLLVDQAMPGMDGVEVANAMRTAGGDMNRVVMLITSAEGEEHQRAISAGVVWFLTKPVRQELLVNCVASVLGVTDVAARESAAEEAPPTSYESPRILLVEDNPINREVCITMLQDLDCNISFATNGREALEELSRATYDLVLMDCQMPEMNGYEATDSIRQQERTLPEGTSARLPIIALTAHAHLEDREHCLAAGMDDHLAKPFTKEQLRAIIGRWVKRDS